MFIWCDFYLDDFDLGRYVKLTPDIDSSLLTASPTQQRDPVVLARSLELAKEYEHEFTRTFNSMKPNQNVDVFGAAFFDPLDSAECADVLTMRFVRVERDVESDKILEILLESETGQEVKFEQRVLSEYGRFGGVRLWCANVPVSLIDGDIDLNENESTRICVICSSDLFL